MPEEYVRLRVNEMTLIEEAERAEKIRNAFIVFSGPCAQDHNAIQSINKVISELSSLSCVLREINKLIELDTGSGLAIIEDDLKYVHEDVTWTLADIWKCLGRLGRGLTVEDYQKTWKEVTETSWKNDGKSLDRTLEGYRRFLESLSKTLDRYNSTSDGPILPLTQSLSHVMTPTVNELRPEIERIHDRRSPQPPLHAHRPTTPMMSRQNSTRSVQRLPLPRNNSTKLRSPKVTDVKQQKSYERERPLSPDASSVSSASEATRFRDKPWVPSPPLSPTATISSISQVSSTTPSLEMSSHHWAKNVFKNVASTPLPWSNEETRYHEVQGTREHSYPNQAYDPVFNLAYPEGVRVKLYCRLNDYRAKIVVLYKDRKGNSEYGCLPLEDLHLRREGSVLRVCRRKSSGKPVSWVSMKFTTIERMILFAGTFIAMRSQDSSTSGPPPTVHDDELRDEVCEFAGSIVDSGFSHALRIYHDRITGAIRLQGSVLKGELDRTPVWTAFITHVITSPDWCRRVDRKTVALADLKLHIFSARYKPYLAPSGAFMLRFETREDTESFWEILEDLRTTLGGYSH